MLKKLWRKIKEIISSPTEREKRVREWKRNGNEKLRYDYDLNTDSVAFDLGGYKGQWTSDIFSMYSSNILIFEPVKKYFEDIKERFSKNNKIKVFQFGLSDRDVEISAGLDHDGSSVFNEETKNREIIKLKKASDFFKENNIQKIDLIKINIEGGEYDLLENLIESGYIEICKDIQIQFHDFVPKAKERMLEFRKKLAETHEATYQCDFVWENWRRKQK